MKIRFGIVQAEHVGTNQCGACRLVFNSLTAFDGHRRDFKCLDPAAAGLRVSRHSTFRTADGPMSFDVWAFPGREEGVAPAAGEPQNRFSGVAEGDDSLGRSQTAVAGAL